jgi:formate dehydrogenase subunit gamma
VREAQKKRIEPMQIARLKLILALIALLTLALPGAPARAQQSAPIDPNTSAVHEEQLLQQLHTIRGLGSIPDVKSYTLEQPQGQEWRHYHEVTLRWIGGIILLGALAVLVFYYFIRGTLRLEAGRSGRLILRFTAYERFVHWMMATCFIILGLSGLNITYGRPLLLPLMSPEAFTAISEWAKYAHNYLSFPFTLGVILMFFMWVGRNVITRVDIDWLKRGGGMIGHDQPPAYFFNAGQKILFWLIMLAGICLAVSGYILIFPFYGTDIHAMQLAEVGHSIIAVLFIATILGHIYLGTFGMEGAYESMSQGTVDTNWAKEHHALWYEGKTEHDKTEPAHAQPSAPGE